MKAILITYDQAHHDNIRTALDKSGCRGFTSFGTVQGRGSVNGEPHYGSHAWPSLGEAIITVTDEHNCSQLLKRLKQIDDEKPALGLRAFVWNVEDSI